MSKVLVSESNLQAIADSIRTKKGEASTVKYTPGEMSAAIDEIQTGGAITVANENNVNFYDYDGTILYSYSANEFLSLSELPANPSHNGLTAQGWNWNLSDAKNYVSEHGNLNIGQTYVTDDGKTRIYIHLEEGRTSPYLGFAIMGNVTVDWGDGNTQTKTGISTNTITSMQHNYAKPGNYIITLDSSNTIRFAGENYYTKLFWKGVSRSQVNIVYSNSIKKIELGSNIVLGINAFNYCTSLKSITIPNGITSIDNNTFNWCNSLQSITIPKTVTTISESAFNACRSLQSITIPNSVTKIDKYFVSNCSSLQSITIPNSVTSIGYSAMSTCSSLSKITVSNNITSINSDTFSACFPLSKLTIPSGVTSIASSAFSNCYGVRYYDFSNCSSVPTLSNTSAFTGIQSECQIIVPDELYDDWIVATNWSTYASYIVKSSEVQL